MKQIIERITANPRYQENVEYGELRSGHPEGKVKYHMAALEENLEKFFSRGISEERSWKLKFLIHVHGTFKAKATLIRPS